MRTFFYYMVEVITEHITGLENGNMKLWDLFEYMRVSEKVIIGVNIIGLIVAVAFALLIAMLSIMIFQYYNGTYTEEDI